jgi:polysaccharide export outer membrane protein
VFLEGEVARPGAIEVLNEVLTLQQAIALAGGTTLFATLSDVEIIRNDNGKQRIVHLDLRNDEIYTTKKEFFYLKQNDYISIKANKEKIVSSNQSAARTISYASTALTILLAMFTIFR